MNNNVSLTDWGIWSYVHYESWKQNIVTTQKVEADQQRKEQEKQLQELREEKEIELHEFCHATKIDNMQLYKQNQVLEQTLAK